MEFTGIDLNSSDEEEAPQLPRLQLQLPLAGAAPVHPTSDTTAEGMDVDALAEVEQAEQVHDVDVNFVEFVDVEEDAAVAEKEELDPHALGVPALKTLSRGDRVEVLWLHGASH